jgi:uncharacterized protein (TIGR02594 family)
MAKPIRQSTRSAETDATLQRKQIELKDKEIAQKEKELTRSWYQNPLILAIAAGAFTLSGNIVASVINGYNSSRVEEQKIQGQLLLESIKTGDEKKAICNLDLLVQSGIFSVARFPDMAKYVSDRNEECTGPELPVSAETAPAAACNSSFLPSKSEMERILKDSKSAKTDRWMATALGEVGVCESTETGDHRVGEYWQSVGYQLTGKDNTVPWSAAFVSWVIKNSGIGQEGSSEGFGFQSWGVQAKKPIIGAVLIARRGNEFFDPKNLGPRIVGFYVGEDLDGNPFVVGGNFGNQVTIMKIEKNRVIDMRLPADFVQSD